MPFSLIRIYWTSYLPWSWSENFFLQPGIYLPGYNASHPRIRIFFKHTSIILVLGKGKSPEAQNVLISVCYWKLGSLRMSHPHSVSKISVTAVLSLPKINLNTAARRYQVGNKLIA